MSYSCVSSLRHISLSALTLALGACAQPVPGVTTEFDYDVSGVATDDTLQDVFPQITHPAAVQDGLVTGLVDGGSRNTVPLLGQAMPGNGTRLDHRHGPVLITWDLGEEGTPDKARLDAVWIWLYAKNGRNFHGQLSISKDGKSFAAIPGTLVEKEFPEGKDPGKLMHRIRYAFAPDEVTVFRFLRLESFGYRKQTCQIQEVDGWIRGVSPRKSTEIRTVVRPLTAEQLSIPPVEDQTLTPPMAVQPLRFAGSKLALARTGRSLLDCSDILAAPGAGWTLEQRKETARNVSSVAKRADGLVRTSRLAVDDENRVSLLVQLELPADAAKPVPFENLSLRFGEGVVRFDGITYGSGAGPTFIKREHATTVHIGTRTPYVIFPCREQGIEVQFYMPDWYGITGDISAFADDALCVWELYAATRNTRRELENPQLELDAGRWHPTVRQLKPGEVIAWRINIAVFSITPPTIGQKDIETTHSFGPLTGIEMGTGDQKVTGTPRVLQRDKMVFMGFKLPAPALEKPGHQFQIEPWMDPVPLLDRFAKSGVGILTLFSDYRDVSHGVSYRGDYEKAPPGYRELLRKINARGLKPVCWFSPRGFLQKDWGSGAAGIPKDALVEEHPDWFTPHAHWFGYYRTVDTFNPEPNEWEEAKFRQDLGRFPELGGFAYDCFPMARLTVDDTPRTTALANEIRWLKRFTDTIHGSGAGKVVLANGSVPLYDEYRHYDYTASEHPLLMFVNDITAGHMPFGHTFVPWELFGQLYFWYSVIGHMYYNFCDYDQAVGWVGPRWIGMLNGQMEKDFDRHVAPIWYIMGKGRRVYGARVAPGIRQIEAAMPDESIVMLLCHMGAKTRDVQALPQRLSKRRYRVSATIDTAKEHRDAPPFEIDLKKQPGFEVEDMPPYSIVVFRFELSPEGL